jgi:hypothetical protein
MKPRLAKTFLFWAVPASLLLVGIAWGVMELKRFALTSDYFRVQRVEVSPTSTRVTREEVLSLLKVSSRANVFALDLNELRLRAETHPWIHAATITRALPSRLEVRVQEQVPVAILSLEQLFYLNKDGRAFAPVELGGTLKLPLLSVEGEKGGGDELRARIKAALEFLPQLQASPLFRESDLGDFTIRRGPEGDSAPFLVTLAFPPEAVRKKGQGRTRLYTGIFGAAEGAQQVARWEAVVRQLVQTGKIPRLIRLELGKKVVVKLDR